MIFNTNNLIFSYVYYYLINQGFCTIFILHYLLLILYTLYNVVIEYNSQTSYLIATRCYYPNLFTVESSLVNAIADSTKSGLILEHLHFECL